MIVTSRAQEVAGHRLRAMPSFQRAAILDGACPYNQALRTAQPPVPPTGVPAIRRHRRIHHSAGIWRIAKVVLRYLLNLARRRPRRRRRRTRRGRLFLDHNWSRPASQHRSRGLRRDTC